MGGIGMVEEANSLCARIRERCKLQCWYGSDIDARWYTEPGRYRLACDPFGNIHFFDEFPRSNSLATNFEFPPATAAQLHKTEQALGFSLPAILRSLYMQVANGGFGPDYGIIGCIGGFGDAGNIVEGYQFHVTRNQLLELINASIFRRYQRHTGPASWFPCVIWEKPSSSVSMAILGGLYVSIQVRTSFISAWR